MNVAQGTVGPAASSLPGAAQVPPAIPNAQTQHLSTHALRPKRATVAAYSAEAHLRNLPEAPQRDFRDNFAVQCGSALPVPCPPPQKFSGVDSPTRRHARNPRQIQVGGVALSSPWLAQEKLLAIRELDMRETTGGVRVRLRICFILGLRPAAMERNVRCMSARCRRKTAAC